MPGNNRNIFLAAAILFAIDTIFFLAGGPFCNIGIIEPAWALLFALFVLLGFSCLVAVVAATLDRLAGLIPGSGETLHEILKSAAVYILAAAIFILVILISRNVPFSLYFWARGVLGDSFIMGFALLFAVGLSSLLMRVAFFGKHPWLMTFIWIPICLLDRYAFVRIYVLAHDQLALAAILSIFIMNDGEGKEILRVKELALQNLKLLFFSFALFILAASIATFFPDARASAYERMLLAPKVHYWMSSFTDFDRDGYALFGALPDCNDSDGAIHPFALDAVGDGVAQNCDGRDLKEKEMIDFARRRLERPGPPAAPELSGRSILWLTLDALRADSFDSFLEGSALLRNRKSEFIRFERAFTQSNGTRMSALGLFSGRYITSLAAYHKVRGEFFLTGILGSAGYDTTLISTTGKLDYKGVIKKTFGNVVILPDAVRGGATSSELIARELERIGWAEKIKDGPRFLWLHLYDSHDPYIVPAGKEAPGEPFERYRSALKHSAAAISPFLESLFDLPEEVRPIILISADHGEEFLDHGGRYHVNSLFDELVHVPLWIHIPGSKGYSETRNVTQVDMAPSFLGLLGLGPPPFNFDGVNVFDGDALEGRKDPIWLMSAYTGIFLGNAIISGRFKLIHDQVKNLHYLYDIRADPGERNNLFYKNRDGSRRMIRLRDEFYDILKYNETAGLDWIEKAGAL